MFHLTQSVQAWDTDAFNDVLKKEIRSIDSKLLPLQQGLAHSDLAIGDNIHASILSTEENKEQLLIKAGLFYTGIISGCNCADDPTPINENNEYCEVLFCIDKKTAQTRVTLLD